MAKLNGWRLPRELQTKIDLENRIRNQDENQCGCQAPVGPLMLPTILLIRLPYDLDIRGSDLRGRRI